MPENLKRYSLSEAKEIMNDLGLEGYRVEQVFKWIWQKGARNFSEMTNISKEWRDFLAQTYSLNGPIAGRIHHEGEDAQKYVMLLEDGEKID